MIGRKFKCEMDSSPWFFAFASAIGNGHIAENLPCQDSCIVEHFKNFSITVVADGAGSCLNSHIGSALVTQYCVFHFREIVVRKGWNSKRTSPTEQEWHQEAKIALHKVRTDMENFCISNELELKSLSSTVIVLIALRFGLLVTHIGDGRAGYCNAELVWVPIIIPYHGEFANETVFITSDFWELDTIDEYIESRVIREPINAFCVLSDGCEKASFQCYLFDKEKEVYYDPNTPHPQFFNPNVEALLQLIESGMNQNEINDLWRNFLTEGNLKLQSELDDKTMVLGIRKPVKK